MLKDMPVGNPILTTKTNLNELFGFVYGTITPPNSVNFKNTFNTNKS